MTTRQRVEELEGEIKVQDLKVKAFGKEFQVYPWLKGRLFHKIITGNETNQNKSVGLYLKQLGSLFYGIHNIFRRHDIWAFSNSIERRLIEDKYHDKLFDYIGNSCGYRMLLIELRIFKYYPYRKIASKRAVSKSFFILFEEIYRRIFLGKKEVNSKELLNSVLSKVPDGIDHNFLIQKNLAQYKMMKFWLKVIRNPKVVLISVSYSNFGYIRAFKEKGIKVIEVQHGIISKNHHAYYYKKKFDPIQFPDSILTVGEKERAVFDEENKFPVNEVVPIGSFIIDYYATQTKAIHQNEKPRVLFVLQDGEMGVKFTEFILELEKQSKDAYDFIIQPRRNGKDYYISQNPEVAHLVFSDKDFYSTIVNVDIHSTVYSTTAIEALSLGVPNILVNIDNQTIEQLGTVLSNNPYTSIINKVSEFLDAVEDKLNIDPETIQLSNEANIKAGYKSNIKPLMEDMVNG